MSNVLQQFSDDLADLVSAASPSVVRVDARRRVPASGIVWSEEGIIISADHVVEHDDAVQVHLDDGTEIAAAVVGRDPGTDVIVLRAEATGLMAATWADASQLRVGALAVALGRPFFGVQSSVGTLSAVGGAWRTHSGAQVEQFVRPDIVMYPGFSGGALVLATGEVAGMTTSGLLSDTSVAIPAATLQRTVSTILAHGRVPRGYLGIGVQPVRISAGLAETLGADAGLMIMSVEQGAPAEAAGVRQGDILVTVDGEPVQSVGDLRLALTVQTAANAVSLRIIRSDQIVDITAELELK